MSKVESYQDLEVWREAMTLAELVYKVTVNYPQEEQFGLKSQMRRAAVSIPSNIAEGWGRGMTKDYIRFLRISRGSLKELETQIILSTRLQMTSERTQETLLDLAESIGRMLVALERSLQKHL